MTRRRLFVLAGSAFALNWVWEMAHMGGYVGMATRPWWETAVRCARASLADAAVVGVVSMLSLRMAHGRRVYLVAAVLGLGAAGLIEWVALATRRWVYAPSMPVVPGLGLGVSALLQLTILTPLSLWLSSRRGRKDHQTGDRQRGPGEHAAAG